MKHVVSGLLLLLASACNLTSFGESYEQSSCVGMPETFCSELNGIAPLGDDCQTWRCHPTEGVCAVMAPDNDGDGASNADCKEQAEARGETVDCNDNPDDALAALQSPDLEESCDGIDNDCDGIVDEGSYQARDVKRVRVTLGAGERVFFPAGAGFRSALDDLIAVLHGFFVVGTEANVMSKIERSGRLVGANVEDFSQGNVAGENVVRGVPDMPIQPVRGLAATHTAMGTLLAYTDNTSIHVGRYSPMEGTFGLPTMFELVGAKVGQLAMDHFPASQRALLAYVNRAATTPECTPLDAENVELLAFPPDVGSLVTETTGATTEGSHPPAVVGVATDAYLAAFQSPGENSNRIAIYLVRTQPTVTSELVLAISTGDFPGEVALAVNPDRTQVALAYREGCLPDSRIMFRQYGWSLAAKSLTEVTNLDLHADRSLPRGRRPAVRHQSIERPDGSTWNEWLVAWEEARQHTLLARVAEGAPVENFVLYSAGALVLEGTQLVTGPGENGVVVGATHAVGADAGQAFLAICE